MLGQPMQQVVSSYVNGDVDDKPAWSILPVTPTMLAQAMLLVRKGKPSDALRKQYRCSDTA